MLVDLEIATTAAAAAAASVGPRAGAAVRVAEQTTIPTWKSGWLECSDSNYQTHEDVSKAV